MAKQTKQTSKDKAAKVLLQAVNDVLGVGDDGGSMDWIDWDLLRKAKTAALKAGL
jgi:hypothetical protein